MASDQALLDSTGGSENDCQQKDSKAAYVFHLCDIQPSYELCLRGQIVPILRHTRALTGQTVNYFCPVLKGAVFCICYDGHSTLPIAPMKHEGGTIMAYRWPAGTVFTRIELDVEERSCPVCDRDRHVGDHRSHHLWTLAGPTQVGNRLVRCPDPTCDSRGQPFSPAAALAISMPRWCLGWEVLCWLGHRRCARHWSVPQLRAA
jgi:hypothetical protein